MSVIIMSDNAYTEAILVAFCADFNVIAFVQKMNCNCLRNCNSLLGSGADDGNIFI